MGKRGTLRKKQHEQTMQILPWFVNDTLDPKEREQVLKHLAESEELRAERDRLVQLQQLIQEGDSEGSDVDLSFRRTMKRIEDSERNRRSLEEVHVVSRQRRLFVSTAMAAGLSILLIGSAVLVGQQQGPIEYQALTSDQPGTVSQGMTHQMEIGFVDPIPVATLRQALIETGSNIVSGPDDTGVYLVEVVVPGEVSQDVFLKQIQGINGVKHAAFTASQ